MNPSTKASARKGSILSRWRSQRDARDWALYEEFRSQDQRGSLPAADVRRVERIVSNVCQIARCPEPELTVVRGEAFGVVPFSGSLYGLRVGIDGIRDMTDQQVRAICAHEIGHIKNQDRKPFKDDKLLRSAPWVALGGFGVSVFNSVIARLVFLSANLLVVTSAVGAQVARARERRSDRFAVNLLRDPSAVAGALGEPEPGTEGWTVSNAISALFDPHLLTGPRQRRIQAMTPRPFDLEAIERRRTEISVHPGFEARLQDEPRRQTSPEPHGATAPMSPSLHSDTAADASPDVVVLSKPESESPTPLPRTAPPGPLEATHRPIFGDSWGTHEGNARNGPDVTPPSPDSGTAQRRGPEGLEFPTP